jgi:hypothetical protein
MSTRRFILRGLSLGSLLFAATLSAAPAFAATKAGPPDARASLQRDRVACMRLREDDARQNCLSEASTRFASTQPSAADEDAAQLLRNALRRCEPLHDADKQDCVARIQGQGTTSGSVAGGGIYRELVTREVGVAAVPVPEDLPAPAAEVK